MLILIILILIYLIFLLKTAFDTKIDEEKLANKLLLSLGEILQENKDFLNENLRKNNQGMQITLNNLENQVQNKFELQNSNQELQFEKIRAQNQLLLSESLNRTQKSIQEQLNQSVRELIDLNNKNFQLLLQTNQEKLNQINLELQKRLDENFSQNLKSFQEVTHNLGQIQGTAKEMIKSTESIEKLNNIFARTSSKAFGDFSEKYLEALLREHLAIESWNSQVKIPDSEDKIDFVIFIENKKIGIDSKFPVTRYQDFLNANIHEKPTKLKEYLQEITRMAKDMYLKYYKNNFLDVLFLYLPSDSMYSEVANDPQIVGLLQKLKITACSPTTIFPLIVMIQTHQYKLSINHNAQNIIDGLTDINKNVQSFREEFRKLGDKIRQAQNNYNEANYSLDGVENNILKLKNSRNKEEETSKTELTQEIL